MTVVFGTDDARRAAEVRAGRDAAWRLATEWPDVSWVPSDVSEDWAQGA